MASRYLSTAADDEGDFGFIASATRGHSTKLSSKEETLPSRTRNLNIKSTYVSDWGGKEAFRELYQNWKDAIINTFGLSPEQFKPNRVWDSKGRTETITVRHPTLLDDDYHQKKLLGYIRWQGDKNEKNLGTVEVCNFNASLYLENFGLGDSTKKDYPTAAGEHGEGFKHACLAFCRNSQGYIVTILACNKLVTLQFDANSMLCAKIALPKKTAKEKQLRKENAEPRFAEQRRSKQPRALEGKIWEDVCFRIGFPGQYQDSRGNKVPTSKVSRDDFRTWLKQTPDIDPPQEIIRTPHGWLILTGFKNQMFLKGTKLPRTANNLREYLFGYAFLQDNTNRDRGSIADINQEVREVTKILFAAAHIDDKIMAKVCKNLLVTESSRCADVQYAERFMSEADRRRIWLHLQGLDCFFYREGNGLEERTFIEKYSNKPARAMPASLWDFLQDGSALSPALMSYSEYRASAIRALDPVDNDFWANSYSKTMKRLLKACLNAHPSTADKSFIVVEGDHLGLDIYYDDEDGIWRMDATLFDSTALHNRSWICCDCTYSSQLTRTGEDGDHVFLCHQAASQIYACIVLELGPSDFEFVTKKEAEDHKRSLIASASGLLRSVPLAVRIPQTGLAGDLQVSWESAENPAVFRNIAITWRVTLHRLASCRSERKFLKWNGEESCSCPYVESCHDHPKPIFEGLNANEEYFPMVSRATVGAIFGEIPPSCLPLEQDQDTEMEDGKIEAESVDDDEFVDEDAATTSVTSSTSRPQRDESSSDASSSSPNRAIVVPMQLDQRSGVAISHEAATGISFRTYGSAGREIPPVPAENSYLKGKQLSWDREALQLPHFPGNRNWYKAENLGGQQNNAFIGILNKKRKAPMDDDDEDGEDEEDEQQA